MTALAGYWSFGAPGEARRRCGRMLDAQAVYGPGAPAVAAEGGLAVGRRLAPILPEDRFDRGPVRGAGGRLLLAADVRLDNRPELAAALGIDAGEAASLCDVALLMKAWESWEEAALDRIVGDFAFALWDSKRERLLLARDFVGQKPLFLARGPDFAAFASMPRGLHALPEIPYEPDREALLGFTALAPEQGESSFFRGIERAPPGHLVALTREGIERTRYWQPSLRPLRLGKEEEYAEAVRAALDEAVAARLRGGEGRLGAHLSGGLDSSAVTAAAALLLGEKGRLTAFTAIPRAGFSAQPGNRIIDEGPLAAATAALHPNVDHVLVDADGRSPLDGLERAFQLYQRPLPNPCNAVWWDAILDSARGRGIAVLLTGQAGNLSFSASGMQAPARLLASGRLLRFGREAAGLLRGGMSFRMLAGQTLAPLLPGGLWRAWQAWRSLAHRRADYSFAPASAGAEGSDGIDFARQPSLDAAPARLRALGAYDPGAFNKGALAGWGIDVRDPTADRRLVELCLAIPEEEFLAGGVPRGLARRILAGRLPPALLEERRRGYQGADWYERLDADRPALAEEVGRIAACEAAGAAVDPDRLRRALEDWPEQGWTSDRIEATYRRALLRGVAAGHFTRRATGANS